MDRRWVREVADSSRLCCEYSPDIPFCTDVLAGE